MRHISLEELLPPDGLLALTKKLNQLKEKKPLTPHKELVEVLKPYRKTLEEKEVDLDYLAYFLEYQFLMK